MAVNARNGTLVSPSRMILLGSLRHALMRANQALVAVFENEDGMHGEPMQAAVMLEGRCDFSSLPYTFEARFYFHYKLRHPAQPNVYNLSVKHANDELAIVCQSSDFFSGDLPDFFFSCDLSFSGGQKSLECHAERILSKLLN